MLGASQEAIRQLKKQRDQEEAIDMLQKTFEEK
jgi:hypothetical protein